MELQVTDSVTTSKRPKLDMEMGEEEKMTRARLTSPITTPMLFPEHWEHVFRDLPPKDFLSVINTCPQWNELMAPRKTISLLPLVLPKVLEYLTKEQILLCRRVSKHWKSVVDSVLETKTQLSTTSRPMLFESVFEFKHEENNLRRGFHYDLGSIARHYNFKSSDIVQKFMTFGNRRYEDNPFLGRRITISYGGTPPDPHLEHLFSQFGHHIWRLKFFLGDFDNRFGMEHEMKLVSLLNLSPNLKSLEIYYFRRREEGELVLEQSSSFPELKYLEALALREEWELGFEGKDSYFLAFLQKYGPQLKSLFLGAATTLWLPTVNFFQECFPILKHLHFENISINYLQKLSEISLPLEKLTFDDYFDDDWSNNQLFQFIGNFSQTLSELELLFQKPHHDLDPPTNPENMKILPKLKTLRLQISLMETEWVWDFLEKMCGNVQVIHFDPKWSAKPKRRRKIAQKAFQVLSCLNRVVFWDKKDDNDEDEARLYKTVFRREAL